MADTLLAGRSIQGGEYTGKASRPGHQSQYPVLAKRIFISRHLGQRYSVSSRTMEEGRCTRALCPNCGRLVDNPLRFQENTVPISLPVSGGRYKPGSL
jgi:hypothetical protein